jgi:hypothetical protein
MEIAEVAEICGWRFFCAHFNQFFDFTDFFNAFFGISENISPSFQTCSMIK